MKIIKTKNQKQNKWKKEKITSVNFNIKLIIKVNNNKY